MQKTWTVHSLKAYAVLIFLLLFVKQLNAQDNETDFFSFDESKIKLEGNLRPFTSSIKVEKLGMDRFMVDIHLHTEVPSLPPSFTLKISFPKENINQLWNSQTWSNKSYFTLPAYDRAASEFSIISGLTINDQNQITFTCQDDYNSRFINTYVREEDNTLVFGLSFFDDNPPISKLTNYHVQLLADFRNVHFSKAIFEASKWRFEDEFKKGIASADTTKAPFYSTWYPMHRNIPLANISRELDSLRNYNFKSILIDDGWRSLVKMKVDTAYSYEDESFKTMQEFNTKRKDMGLNLYLWYSIPFMGGNPVISKRFAGKYINYKAPMQLHVLDPRYADVRNHLISTYTNFYKNWKFDGYWFDFLHHFYPKHTTTISEDLGRDYVDVSLAIDQISEQIESRLTEINPDIFLGHDFKSVGPDRGMNHNLLGGFVGVKGTQIVREKMVNNRLLYGQFTPCIEILGIHSRDKSPEVARKFQSIIFGNPYVSFYNTTMPADNKQTIRFWLQYWKKNYDVLMKGDFRPMKVSRNYPAIKVENESKIIYTLYGDYPLNLPLQIDKELDVINSKVTAEIYFITSRAGMTYEYAIYNHLGVAIEKDVLKTKKKNNATFLVPEGGFIRFQANH